MGTLFTRYRMLFFAVVALLLIWGAFFLRTWLHTTLEYTPISITSSGKMVSFFDSQKVTQKIKMDQPAEIVRLEIPWQPPTVDTPVVIEMHRYGKLLSRWRISIVGDGSVKVLLLPLPIPQYIDGILDISFTASAISREQLEFAPKLLLEPLDESFDSGNYRINDEEKQGDIDMRLIAQQTRIEVLRQSFGNAPARGVGILFSSLVILCLVLALPFLLRRYIKE